MPVPLGGAYSPGAYALGLMSPPSPEAPSQLPLPHPRQPPVSPPPRAVVARASPLAIPPPSTVSLVSPLPIPQPPLQPIDVPPAPDRLSVLEDSVKGLSSTLDAIKKALKHQDAAAVPPSPSPSPSPSVPISMVSASSAPASKMLLPYSYGSDEAAGIKERFSRAVRGLKVITAPEAQRLADYVHPPPAILQYIKVLVVLLGLGHKSSWSKGDLVSDRRELWGSGWRELKTLVGGKPLVEKLGAVRPEDVSADVRFLLDAMLSGDEVDTKLGRISFAAIALGEYVHALYGAVKFSCGLKEGPPPHGCTKPQQRSRVRRRTPLSSRRRSSSGRREASVPQQRQKSQTRREPSIPQHQHQIPHQPAEAPLPVPVVGDVPLTPVHIAPAAREVISPPIYKHRTSPSPARTPATPSRVPGPTASVAAWLTALSLPQYIPAFEENEIDFDTLLLLTDKDLDDMAIPIGPKKKILHALQFV